MTRPIPIPPEVQEAFDRAFTIEGRPFACAFAAALAAWPGMRDWWYDGKPTIYLPLQPKDDA